ncbi:hypothetical protein [Dyella telluris]|uniref:Uncharacterized protein n=1 Tax=Dyella telluris TaxID=2763498 RepID=A0A7G8Q5H9_9GAMM|nr:hypothetical protein [Dyella telluris]QNK02037.1 hypothetical protein H8F01_02405 [Dyella telluris]
MSSLIVARFGSQFAAASAFAKLMSCGLYRRKGVVQCDESVDGSPASASAPTSVVSSVSHQGRRDGAKHVLRGPEASPDPADMGSAILTVEIDDDQPLEEVMEVMRAMDAVHVHILPGKILDDNDAPLWPEEGLGRWADVQRAVRASRRGKPRLH